MADPRARITAARQIPPPPDRPSFPTTTDTDGLDEQGSALFRLPGKAHGRRRSVCVYLPAPERHWLDDQAAIRSVTKAEIVLDSLAALHRSTAPPPDEVSPLVPPRRRTAVRRGLDHPRPTYLLLTIPEARAVAELAHKLDLTLSDLVTRALRPETGST